jgi:hypothetical protein
METMTEEEAFALDEYYTNNPPRQFVALRAL